MLVRKKDVSKNCGFQFVGSKWGFVVQMGHSCKVGFATSGPKVFNS